MKQWMMPRVEIEGFAANEYVAACSIIVNPINPSERYAVDFYGDRYRLDFDGPANGKFDGVNDELIQNGNLPSGFTDAGNNATGKWYTNKTVYRVKVKPLPNGINGSSYTNSTYWEPVGTYDIYVTNKGVVFWCYPQGTGGGFNPDEKNYS